MGGVRCGRSPDLSEMLIFQAAYLHLHIYIKHDSSCSCPYPKEMSSDFTQRYNEAKHVRIQPLAERPCTTSLHGDSSVSAHVTLRWSYHQIRNPL